MGPASWSPPITILLLPWNRWVSGIGKDADGRWGKMGNWEFRLYENIGRAGVWEMSSAELESYGKLGWDENGPWGQERRMEDWVARWKRGPLGEWRHGWHHEAQKQAQRTGKAPMRKTPLWKVGCGWGKLGFSRDLMTQKSWWFKLPEMRKRAGFICIKHWKQNVRFFIILISEPGIGLHTKKGLYSHPKAFKTHSFCGGKSHCFIWTVCCFALSGEHRDMSLLVTSILGENWGCAGEAQQPLQQWVYKTVSWFSFVCLFVNYTS